MIILLGIAGGAFILGLVAGGWVTSWWQAAGRKRVALLAEARKGERERGLEAVRRAGREAWQQQRGERRDG